MLSKRATYYTYFKLVLFVYLELIYDNAYFNQLSFPGKDVLARAKTGTGKTVAFLVSLFCICV